MKWRVLLSVLIFAVASTTTALELVTDGIISENANTFLHPSSYKRSEWSIDYGEAFVENDAIQFRALGEEGHYLSVTSPSKTPCDAVEFESDLILGGWAEELPLIPPDAQCSIAWLRDGLRVCSGDGWIKVSGAELLGDGRSRHVLFTRIDYNSRTFTMKIDGIVLVDGNGNRFFRLAGNETAARGCAFAGAGAIYSVKAGSRGNDVHHFCENDVRTICENIPDHPRLHVCGPAALAALRNNDSPRAKLMRKRIVASAEENLAKPLTVLGKDAADKRLTGDTAASSIIIVCAAAHAFTEDSRFAERARDEMLSVCAQGANKGWVPTHYLGTAEVLRGLAFGYDWLFHSLTEEERAVIRRAIIDYGFKDMKHWSGWRNNGNNWSHVCWQGVAAAAFAIYEDYENEAVRLIHECVDGLLTATAAYALNGPSPATTIHIR